jgi:hypothetical protein
MSGCRFFLPSPLPTVAGTIKSFNPNFVTLFLSSLLIITVQTKRGYEKGNKKASNHQKQ